MGTPKRPAAPAGLMRVLPHGRHRLSRDAVRASQRERLLQAMTEVTGEQGYAAVTIGDIVARARIARRTFYEHFGDKAACAVAALNRGIDDLLTKVAAQFDPALGPYARADAVNRGFLEFLAANPNFARLYFTEINTAGPEGRAAQLEARGRIAAMIVALREKAGRRQPGTPALSRGHALAVVGALQALYEQALHERGPKRLAEFSDDLVPLTVALLEMLPPAAPRRGTGRNSPQVGGFVRAIRSRGKARKRAVT